MYVVVWRYRVRPENVAAFEREYGAGGSWVEFFRRGAGFVSTDLLRGTEDYVTIDRWTSQAEHERFHAARKSEYEALDARMAALTEEEEEIGAYVVI